MKRTSFSFPWRLIQFIIGMVLFSLITVSVIYGFSWVETFDLTIQKAAFSLRCEPLTFILTLLTYSGNWQVVTAVCILFLLLPKTRKWFGLPLTGSAVTSVALYQFLKYQIQRPRPDAALHIIEQDGFSFPSGHTLSSIMVWGTMVLLLLHYHNTSFGSPLVSQQVGPAARFRSGALHRPSPGKGLTMFLCIFFTLYFILMGLSRIYVGVHWPTDVLGSWFLGLAALSVISKIIEKI